MKIQLPTSAMRTLKYTAAAFFCFGIVSTTFAQEPMAALEHYTENGRSIGEQRVAPEVILLVAENPSPSGIFKVKTEEANVRLEIYDESQNAVQAEISSTHPGNFVINLSKLDDGVYTLVASSTFGRTLVDLVKRKGTSETINPDKLMEISVDVTPNTSTGVFIVTAPNNAQISVMDHAMRPTGANAQNLLDNRHRIDLTDKRSGVYFVQVRTKDGMATEKIVKTTPIENEDNGRVAEITVQVYPNPSTGIFNVRAENNAQIQIFDRSMQAVNAPIQNLLDKTHRIDMTNFDSGMYFVQIITKQGMATKQITKR